ncbi:hypothetical protein R6Q59_019227, partial [Mikania micrantha]
LFGLPLRPGQPVCLHYSLHGICKYGSGCKYDHPLMVYTCYFIPGLTSLAMVDPTLLSYPEMNLSEAPLSKSLKNPSLTNDQIDNFIGSSCSSSQNQFD